MRRKTCWLAAMLAVMPMNVLAGEDTAQWRAESSEQFRQGFVAGIASYLMDFGGGGIADAGTRRAGYADCLAGETDGSLLDVVEIWLGAHAEAMSYAPSIAVSMAIGDYCNGFMPQRPKMP